MTRITPSPDAELDDLFDGDPGLLDIAEQARTTRFNATPSRQFHHNLRASLLKEARSRKAWRTWWHFTPRTPRFAFRTASVGVVLVAAAVMALTVARAPHQPSLVTASSTLSEQHSVDPDNSITVNFSQPMNHDAVVAGLHIEPATTVTTSWDGTMLVITPTHHLAANTPYVVTIDHDAARAADGTVATQDIQISFGTAPTPVVSTPTPSPSAPPTLVTTTVAPLDKSGEILFAPDGSLVLTSTPHSQGSPSPGIEGSGSTMMAFSPTGSATELGLSAQRAAFSPDGHSIAFVVADETGATIYVRRDDQPDAQLVTRTDLATTDVGWTSDGNVLFSSSEGISAAAIDGHATIFVAPPEKAPGHTRFVPGGRYAYVEPVSSTNGNSGMLLDLTSLDEQPLAGSATNVALSGDGNTLAWVDTAQTPQKLSLRHLNGDATTTALHTTPSTDSFSALALSSDGTTIAYTASVSGGQKSFVQQVSSDIPLAMGPSASTFDFSPSGEKLALVTGDESHQIVTTADIPGITPTALKPTVPEAAQATLDNFIAAQVKADSAALSALATEGVVTTTPTGLSRGSIVVTRLSSDNTVVATVRLVIDPSGGHTATRVADETVTLTPSGDGGAYKVSALTIGTLHKQANGPVITHVSSGNSDTGSVISITFDSDIDSTTVTPALSVTLADGTAVDYTATYMPTTRRITITATHSLPLQLTIAPTLTDINGKKLSSAFETTVGS